MKAVLGPHLKALSGSDGTVGGHVYLTLMGMQCLRLHVMPAQPRTADQLLIRGYLTAAAQAFGSLDAAERAAWEVYANLCKKSHLGYEYMYYAINAYIQINVYRQIAGEAITDVAPTAIAGFSASVIATLGYVTGTTVFSFILTHNGVAATGYWACYQTPVLASAQRAARPSDFRLADAVAATSIVAVAATPQTVEITSPKYVPEDGDHMAVKVIPLSDDYAPGPPTEYRSTVTVT